MCVFLQALAPLPWVPLSEAIPPSVKPFSSPAAKCHHLADFPPLHGVQLLMSDPLMLLSTSSGGSPRLRTCLCPPVLRTAVRCAFRSAALPASLTPQGQASLGVLFPLSQMQTPRPRSHMPPSLLHQDSPCAPASSSCPWPAPAVPVPQGPAYMPPHPCSLDRVRRGPGTELCGAQGPAPTRLYMR